LSRSPATPAVFPLVLLRRFRFVLSILPVAGSALLAVLLLAVVVLRPGFGPLLLAILALGAGLRPLLLAIPAFLTVLLAVLALL